MAGLYIHIPFCTQRCIYCDFYFVTTESDHGPFLNALSEEIRIQSGRFSHESLDTIYLGGGTPSALRASEVAHILSDVERYFETAKVHEVTFELNPENASPGYLEALQSAGVNRLSIGIQSFFEDDLEFMGRSHSVNEARQVIPMAREAGFEQLSVDLIFGVPGQPASAWMRNLQHAASEHAPHLSTYGLTIEPDTPLANQIARGLVSPAPDEEMVDRYQITMDFLRDAGYEHYEISSFALPNARAQHNQSYWTHANYIGLGPSAHSFWWNDQSAQRWANVSNLRQYIKQLEEGELPQERIDTLPLDVLADEHLMLRLRTSDGLDIKRFASRYGRDIATSHELELHELETHDYIHAIENDVLRLTDRGKHVCDSITNRLIS